jgi:transcriptional activator, Rgg/GadR/MutR family, C-terminal domain
VKNVIEKELLGEVFHDIRKKRGLSMKEVGGCEITDSHISKFEKGNAMLSADKLYYALSQMHMTPAEYGYLLNGNESSAYEKLLAQGWRYYYSADSEQLKKLIEKEASRGGKLKFDRLNLIVLKNLLSAIDRNFVYASKEDEAYLSDYFFDVDYWTTADVQIFSSSLDLLSSYLIDKLIRELLKSNYFSGIHDNDRRIKSTLINVLAEFLSRKESAYFEGLEYAVSHIIKKEDVLEIACLNFLNAENQYLKTKDEMFKEKMRSIVSALGVIGAETHEKILQLRIENIQKSN